MRFSYSTILAIALAVHATAAEEITLNDETWLDGVEGRSVV